MPHEVDMDERTVTGHEADGVGPITVITPTKPSLACLVEIYGLEPGTRHDLRGDLISIGRGSESSIVVEMDSISRSHARINFERGRFVLEDLMSTNGTFLNDALVEEEAKLATGDRIKIGSTIYRFLTGPSMEQDYRHEIFRIHIIDGLTGLYNRRYFREALVREVSRAAQYERELALVMFAVDDYEGLIDDFGRIASDHVLSAMCDELTSELRPEELCARYGENQFVIMLPERDTDRATSFADALGVRIGGRQYEFDGDTIEVSISLGVTGLILGDDTDEALITRVVRALGEAREDGPGAVHVVSRSLS